MLRVPNPEAGHILSCVSKEFPYMLQNEQQVSSDAASGFPYGEKVKEGREGTYRRFKISRVR